MNEKRNNYVLKEITSQKIFHALAGLGLTLVLNILFRLASGFLASPVHYLVSESQGGSSRWAPIEIITKFRIFPNILERAQFRTVPVKGIPLDKAASVDKQAADWT